MKIKEIKMARASALSSEIEALRILIDVAPEGAIEEHYQKLVALNNELRSVNADLALLMTEPKFDPNDPDGRTAAVNAAAYRELDQGAPSMVVSGAQATQTAAQIAQTRSEWADKILFRSGEAIASKYDTTGINAEKCLRAAITGDYSKLSDFEKRALTPTAAGALLAPEISSRIIDDLREFDWLNAIAPIFVGMDSGETKIPNITELPTAVMHEPGEEEDSSAPTIAAATLKAKTIMTVVEVANELLQDSATSLGVVMQAATSAISNKLLQQVMYGTGTDAEMKGITLYPAAGFAASANMATEKDIYSLFTKAKTAILKRNGAVDAMLYDPDLESRLNKRLPTGELIEPSRAFTELYSTGHAIAHPSISSGDMIFMQARALFIGMRVSFELQVDPYSALNSNNTKFRLITRADSFANTNRMVYYNGITEVEPE